MRSTEVSSRTLGGLVGALDGRELSPVPRRTVVPGGRRQLWSVALAALFMVSASGPTVAARGARGGRGGRRRKKKETIEAHGSLVTTKGDEREFVAIVAPTNEDYKGSFFFKDDKGVPTSVVWTEIESISFVGRGRTAKIVLRDGSQVTGHPDQYDDSWGDRFPCWSGREPDPDFHFKFRTKPDAPAASETIRYLHIRKITIDEFPEKEEEGKE